MTEPKITVTEGDRDVAKAFLSTYEGEKGLAERFARARTMAAFDERCAAIMRVVGDGSRRFAAVVRMLADVACCSYVDALNFLFSARTDDDIRALILAGWDGTT